MRGRNGQIESYLHTDHLKTRHAHPNLSAMDITKENITKGYEILSKRTEENKRLPQFANNDDWLDNEGNLVEEEMLIVKLGNIDPNIPLTHALTEGEISIATRLISEIVSQKSSKKRVLEEGASDSNHIAVKKVKKTTRPPHANATLKQKIEVLDWHHANGGNQSRTARQFKDTFPSVNIKQANVSHWLKTEEELRERLSSNFRLAGSKRVATTLHPEVTKAVELWVAQTQASHVKLLLSDVILRAKWEHFAEKLEVPRDLWLSLSNGWLQSFKARTGLRRVVRHGEAASVDPESLAKEQIRLRAITDQYVPRDIYNFDESGLYTEMPPNTGLADAPTSGIKGSKKRLTFGFGANADGSDKLQPFIIGKAFKPRDFLKQTGEELGFYYRHNTKAWMTNEFFSEWLLKWDKDLAKENRQILLLVDNFAGHATPEGLKSIRVEYFAPNMTSRIQPMDAGIIRAFKAHYRSKFMLRAIGLYDDNEPIDQIYKIGQLEAMRLSEEAWASISPETIRNCYAKTCIMNSRDQDGSLPPIPPVVLKIGEIKGVQDAEANLRDSLEGLRDRGMLRKSESFSIENLINLPEEHISGTQELTEDEIIELIQEELRPKHVEPSNEEEEAEQCSPGELISATKIVIKNLRLQSGQQFREAEHLLNQLKRRAQREIEDSKVQTNLFHYFK